MSRHFYLFQDVADGELFGAALIESLRVELSLFAPALNGTLAHFDAPCFEPNNQLTNRCRVCGIVERLECVGFDVCGLVVKTAFAAGNRLSVGCSPQVGVAGGAGADVGSILARCEQLLHLFGCEDETAHVYRVGRGLKDIAVAQDQ